MVASKKAVLRLLAQHLGSAIADLTWDRELTAAGLMQSQIDTVLADLSAEFEVSINPLPGQQLLTAGDIVDALNAARHEKGAPSWRL